MSAVISVLNQLDTLVNRHGVRAGRILVGILFLVSGISALLGFKGFVAYTGMFFPAAGLMATLAVILKIGGGLGLILGVRSRLASYALCFFVLLTILFIHGPSLMKATDQMVMQSEMVAILKNIAVLGGLLLVAASAPASLSKQEATPVA